jgi:hypothetical protein
MIAPSIWPRRPSIDASRSRDEIVTRLVLNQHVTPDDRRAVGPFVSRAEVATAIENQLRRDRRFPAEADGRATIVVTLTGTRVVTRRFTSEHVQTFPSVRHAIERYIELEIGPSCGGVRVR